MGEISVGDKINISAEVIGICGNLYNDTVELRLKDGYRINIPISAINEGEERDNKRIVLHAIVQDIIMHEDQFTTIYVHGINSRTIYRFNSIEIDEGIIDLKEGDEVTIECDILEDKFSYYYSSYIKGKTLSDQIITLHPEDCSYIILDNNTESKEDEKPNEDTDSDNNTDNYIFIDSENSTNFSAFINGTMIHVKGEKEQTESDYEWTNPYFQQHCSIDESTQIKITTQVPEKNSLIENFTLQANDIHFTYRRNWSLADSKGLATVTGAIYDKEVCFNLYLDLLLDPVDSEGNVDLEEEYDYVLLSYLFNLPEDETNNKLEVLCSKTGLKFDLKNCMLDKNSFLRIYPVYKDENEKISIGKYECICATTEEIWNKYRFKDALEIYDKMNKTDWASKLDMSDIKGE